MSALFLLSAPGDQDGRQRIVAAGSLLCVGMFAACLMLLCQRAHQQTLVVDDVSASLDNNCVAAVKGAKCVPHKETKNRLIQYAFEKRPLVR